jgi:hypothetical protein
MLPLLCSVLASSTEQMDREMLCTTCPPGPVCNVPTGSALYVLTGPVCNVPTG